MNDPIHEPPAVGFDSKHKTSGQVFGEAGQGLALERGESVEPELTELTELTERHAHTERDSSQDELEQQLLSHTDGITEELDESSNPANHAANRDDDGFDGAAGVANRAARKHDDFEEIKSVVPDRSTEG